MRWRAGDETQRATLRRACQRTPPGTAHSSKQSNSSILSHVLVLERELMKLGPSLEQVRDSHEREREAWSIFGTSSRFRLDSATASSIKRQIAWTGRLFSQVNDRVGVCHKSKGPWAMSRAPPRVPSHPQETDCISTMVRTGTSGERILKKISRIRHCTEASPGGLLLSMLVNAARILHLPVSGGSLYQEVFDC